MRPRRPCGGGPEEAPTAPTASLRSAQHKAWCGPSQGGEEGSSQGGSPAGLAATERRGQGAGGLAAHERRQGAGSTGGRRGSRGGAGGLAAPERRLGAGWTGGRRGRGVLVCDRVSHLP